MTSRAEASRIDRWTATVAGVATVATLLWSALAIAQTRNGAGSTEEAVTAASSSATPTHPLVAGDVTGPPSAAIYDEILSVTDAAAAGDDWFVLDARGQRVHRLSQSGEIIRSFGREGEGPGEFASPDRLTVHYDTVVVAELTRGTLHLYTLEGDFIEDRRLDIRACPAPMSMGLASTAAGIAALLMCPGDMLALEAHVVLQRADGEVQSITVLGGDVDARAVDPFFVPVMAVHPDGLLTGLAGDDCLTVRTLEGAPGEEVCHTWISRIPPRAGERESVREMQQRASAMGFEIALPDALPAMDRVFVAGGVALYRAMAPTEDQAQRLVTEGADGTEYVLDLPIAHQVFAGESGVLLAWDELAGTRILLIPEIPR